MNVLKHRGFIVNIDRIKRRIQLSATALLLSTVFSGMALAAQTGALSVTVTDESGTPLAGATVSASATDVLTTKTGVTGADGKVRLVDLIPSENYVLVMSADGYQTHRNEDALVVTERTLNLTFALVAGSLEEIVTYGRTDLGVLIDTTSALQSTDVTLDILDSLPTGRSYQSYLQFAPSTKATFARRHVTCPKLRP